MRASFSRHRRWQNHIITGAYLLSRYNNNNSSIRYLFLNLELNRSPVLILSNNELTSHLRERERGGGIRCSAFEESSKAEAHMRASTILQPWLTGETNTARRIGTGFPGRVGYFIFKQQQKFFFISMH